MDGTEHLALRHGEQLPFALHTIGGKHPDGTPISLGPWTFECPQVRRVVDRKIQQTLGCNARSVDTDTDRRDTDG